MNFLLAVDAGLKTGLALYGRDGRLIWYRSQNYSSIQRLKRAVYGIYNETKDICVTLVEGGGPLADIWIKESQRRNIRYLQISAETWRNELLNQREQRNGKMAKLNADIPARRVIEWSGAPRPTSLRHDAAEAILAGLWGVHKIGWIKKFPILTPK